MPSQHPKLICDANSRSAILTNETSWGRSLPAEAAESSAAEATKSVTTAEAVTAAAEAIAEATGSPGIKMLAPTGSAGTVLKIAIQPA
jgi:hypothetical protein